MSVRQTSQRAAAKKAMEKIRIIYNVTAPTNAPADVAADVATDVPADARIVLPARDVDIEHAILSNVVDAYDAFTELKNKYKEMHRTRSSEKEVYIAQQEFNETQRSLMEYCLRHESTLQYACQTYSLIKGLSAANKINKIDAYRL